MLGPSAPVAEKVPAEVFTRVDPTGGVPAEVDPNECDRAPTDPNECIRAPADPNGCDPVEANPNGCDPVEADPNGCDPAPSFVRIFYKDEEEEEVPLVHKIADFIEVVEGIVIFLLQLCLLLLAFRIYL
jgi:hypothetical protein